MTVKSLDESIAFYQRLFGFEMKEEGESRGLTYNIIGKDMVHLCMYEKPELQIGDG